MMQWCLDCHRNPAKYVRPRDQVFNMAWERPGRRSRSRRAAGEGIQHRERRSVDQLLDVPPVGDRLRVSRQLFMDCFRHSIASRRLGRPPVLAQPRRAGRHARLSASTCTGSSRNRPPSGTIRRAAAQFLKLMSASLALAGVGACTKQPPEAIVPYVRQPEDLVPGRPLFFASAIPFSGIANPVLVESHMGRPTKIEGNPDHPASLGATDAMTQAAVLGLYDPDRAQTITYSGQLRTWADFRTALTSALAEQKALQGAGLRILSGPITSPSLAELMATVLAGVSARPDGTSTIRCRATARAPRPARRLGGPAKRSTTSTKRTSSSRSTPTSSPAVRAACATRATSPIGAASPKSRRR